MPVEVVGGGPRWRPSLSSSHLKASSLPFWILQLSFFSFLPSVRPSALFHSLDPLPPSPLSSVPSSPLSERGEDEEFILQPSVPQDAPPVTQPFDLLPH